MVTANRQIKTMYVDSLNYYFCGEFLELGKMAKRETVNDDHIIKLNHHASSVSVLNIKLEKKTQITIEA